MDSTKMCRICLAESNDNNQSISIYMKISDVKHRRFSFADQNQQEIITTTPGELTIFDLIISCSLDKVCLLNSYYIPFSNIQIVSPLVSLMFHLGYKF